MFASILIPYLRLCVEMQKKNQYAFEPNDIPSWTLLRQWPLFRSLHHEAGIGVWRTNPEIGRNTSCSGAGYVCIRQLLLWKIVSKIVRESQVKHLQNSLSWSNKHLYSPVSCLKQFHSCKRLKKKQYYPKTKNLRLATCLVYIHFVGKPT